MDSKHVARWTNWKNLVLTRCEILSKSSEAQLRKPFILNPDDNLFLLRRDVVENDRKRGAGRLLQDAGHVQRHGDRAVIRMFRQDNPVSGQFIRGNKKLASPQGTCDDSQEKPEFHDSSAPWE